MCLDECPPSDAPAGRTARGRAPHASSGPSAAGTPTAGRTRRCSPSSRAGTDLDLRGRLRRGAGARSTFPATPWAASASARRREQMVAALGPAAALLPADKPRYLMGVGRPQDILAAVARGIDMFDCVLPTRNGRNASAFTDDGPLRLRNACHKRDPAPLESDCPVLHLPQLQPGVPASPVPGGGDARADAAVAAQRRASTAG